MVLISYAKEGSGQKSPKPSVSLGDFLFKGTKCYYLFSCLIEVVDVILKYPGVPLVYYFAILFHFQCL
jgi:hypothetical protein